MVPLGMHMITITANILMWLVRRRKLWNFCLGLRANPPYVRPYGVMAESAKPQRCKVSAMICHGRKHVPLTT